MTLYDQIIGLSKNRRGLARKMAVRIWLSIEEQRTIEIIEHQPAKYVMDVCRRMGFVCKFRGKVLSGNYNGYKWNVRLIGK